jgi:IMP dehydrogenase
MNISLSYKDIVLVPKVSSETSSRSIDIDTSAAFLTQTLDIPVVCAPMPDVIDEHVAQTLVQNKTGAILHRFQDVDKQVETYKKVANGLICAIGLDDNDRFTKLYTAGCRNFCIDVANGANKRVYDLVNFLKLKYDNVSIIAGNVASLECFIDLAANCPVDAIRVGIANGSVCTTKYATGIYTPMASTIDTIHKWRQLQLYEPEFIPQIIADGGITCVGDICKAIALGADVVMCGNLFARCYDSAAKTTIVNGIDYKLYRGAASYSVQQDVGRIPKYIEGTQQLIKPSVNVMDTITSIKEGFESCFSYFNAKNIQEFRKNVSIERIIP